MKSRLTLGIFFLLTLTLSPIITAQENFNIRQRLNMQMIRKYSAHVANHFEHRIFIFNENHKKMEFFLSDYKEGKDRRFLEQYLERHHVSGFRPYTIQEGKAVATYSNVKVEIGPVEALENRVLLDGKSYKLAHQQGLRSRIVELEQLVEKHIKQHKTTGQKIRNIFTSLPSLISVAHADVSVAEREKFFSQSIVAALIVTGDKLHLKPDVQRDWTGKDKFENIKLMLNKFESSNKQCQIDLVNMRNLHANDHKLHESDIPLASIQDFAFSGELNARVEELENRDIDIESFVKMTELLENHFAVRFSTQLDRNVCWGLFSRPFAERKDDPIIDKACTSFDQLHDCLVEMRHIDKISEAKRSDVSKRFYENRIPARENAFRSSRASGQTR